MILRRNPKPITTVIYQETGFTFQVYRVDCFVETVTAHQTSEFQFDSSFFETDTGQRIVRDPKGRNGIWIIETGVNNWFVKEVK